VNFTGASNSGAPFVFVAADDAMRFFQSGALVEFFPKSLWKQPLEHRRHSFDQIVICDHHNQAPVGGILFSE
jgi:hypothetical protein